MSKASQPKGHCTVLSRFVNSPVTNTFGDRSPQLKQGEMKMFLRKENPKPSLNKAIRRLNQSIKIANKYRHDKYYTPTKKDLKRMNQFVALLWLRYITAQYIRRAMLRSFKK